MFQKIPKEFVKKVTGKEFSLSFHFVFFCEKVLHPYWRMKQTRDKKMRGKVRRGEQQEKKGKNGGGGGGGI